MLRLYTIGYQDRSLAELVAILQRAAVSLLVDVRDVAWSRKRGFSKTALAAGLTAAGIEYEHARFVGNPRSLRAGAESHEEMLVRYDRYLATKPHVIAQFDEFLRSQPATRHRICLLCYEQHPADCHRSILLQHWRLATEDCTPVSHLGVAKAKRFTTRSIENLGEPSHAAAGTTALRSRRHAAV